jgi:hypothetical protein
MTDVWTHTAALWSNQRDGTVLSFSCRGQRRFVLFLKPARPVQASADFKTSVEFRLDKADTFTRTGFTDAGNAVLWSDDDDGGFPSEMAGLLANANTLNVQTTNRSGGHEVATFTLKGAADAVAVPATQCR